MSQMASRYKPALAVISHVRGLHLTGVTTRSWCCRLPRPQHLAVLARLLRSSGDPRSGEMPGWQVSERAVGAVCEHLLDDGVVSVVRLGLDRFGGRVADPGVVAPDS